MEDYFSTTKARESGGDPFAKNPRSTATGLYQFIDSTWNDVRNKHPELGLTEDGRTDPAQAELAMKAHTADNEAFLAKRGVPVTDTNRYLAHRFGAEGAMRALSADPSASVSDIFPEVMKANPDLRGKRIADITGGSRPMGYAATDEEVTPALSARAQLGPGVLAGTRDNQSWDWQNPLIGVGASLASITNPDQGRAIAATATKTAASDQFTTHVDPKTGRGIRLNTKTGQVTPFQAHAPVKDDEKQKAWDKGEAESYVKLNEKIQTDSASSQNSLANIQTLRSTLSNPDVYQGGGGETFASLKKLASTLPGLDIRGVADADLAQTVANRLTLESRALSGGLPGSLSDKDLAFLKDANVSLNKDPAANQRILDIYERLHNRNIERNALRGEYVQKNGMLNEGFNTMLSKKWAAENAERDKLEVAPARAAPTTSTPKMPKGVRSIELITTR